MVSSTQSETLEVIELPNGHFALRAIGASTMAADDEFATRQEAEDALFQRMETNNMSANEPDIIKPGQGQGL